jgi:RNA polymerase sigma factor (sigma-70 family)
MITETDNSQKLKYFFSGEYKSLKIYVKSRIRNSVDHEPDDIIQEVAMKMFERADNLAPIKNITAFVYRSIKNKIVDILRTNNNKTYFEDRFEEFLNEFSSLNTDKPDNSYSEEMKAELYHAISDLKPKYQEIIYMINFEGNTFKKVSKEKNIPVGTFL